MGPYLGNFAEDATVCFQWDTASGSGASITRATDGTIRIYKNNGATQKPSANGVTDTEDFDGLTGVHAVTIDTSDDTGAPGFWVAEADYTVVLAGAVIDGQTVNAVLCSFSIEHRAPTNITLAPTRVVGGTTVWTISDVVTIYQRTASPTFRLDVVDADGNAVDVSGATLKFLATKVNSGDGLWELTGASLSVGGAGNNEVTVTYTTAETASDGTFEYELWDTATSRLYGTGPLIIAKTSPGIPA